MSHFRPGRRLARSLPRAVVAVTLIVMILVLVPGRPASAAVSQNPSQDPTSFGWVHPPTTVPLSFQGHDILGGVASGTQALWTGLLTDLAPQIPGGIQDLGGFEDRQNVNNPSVLSFHAYGLALDINATANPNGVNPSSLSGQFVIPPAAAQAAAAKWGMEWGGKWNDSMHFEIHVTPADAQLLAASNGATPTPPAGGTGTGGQAGTPPDASDNNPCGSAKDDIAGDQTAMSDVASITGQYAIASLCWTLQHIDLGTAPQLNSADKTNWFQTEYTMFRTMALWILMPILLMATIHAVLKGSLALVLKTFFVYLPVSIVAGAVAVGIVQILLNVTDDFTQTFTTSIESDAIRFFSGIADGFGAHGVEQLIPYFATILMGLMLGFSCIGVYIILVLREASVYIASAFLPISLAFFVWPSTAHFFKKLAEFLFAMIFSKLVMVAGISLAVAAMASTTGLDASGETTLAANGGDVGVTGGTPGPGSEPWFTWLGQTMTTTVMFAIVAFAPNMTIKLLSNVGLTNMGRAVSGHSSHPDVMRKAVFLDRTATIVSQFNRGKAAIKAVPQAEQAARATTQQDRALNLAGIKRGHDNSYSIGEDDLDNAGVVDRRLRDQIRQLSISEDVNQIAVAHTALAMGSRYDGYSQVAGHHVLYAKDNADGSKGEAIILADTVDRTNPNRVLNWISPQAIRNAAEAQILAGRTDVRVLVPYSTLNQTADHVSGNFMSQGEGGQHQNAALITRELNDLNQRYGSNAHLIVDSTTTAADFVRGGAAPEAGAGFHDYV